jgi:hypothetical protein
LDQISRRDVVPSQDGGLGIDNIIGPEIGREVRFLVMRSEDVIVSNLKLRWPHGVAEKENRSICTSSTEKIFREWSRHYKQHTLDNRIRDMSNKNRK